LNSKINNKYIRQQQHYSHPGGIFELTRLSELPGAAVIFLSSLAAGTPNGQFFGSAFIAISERYDVRNLQRH
jgi:hypothetical protein